MKELDNLSLTEQLFYTRAMEKYYDDLFTIINLTILQILGNEKEIKEYLEDRKQRIEKETEK